MERSVLIYAGVFLVILVLVVEVLIARVARRREASNVSAPQHDWNEASSRVTKRRDGLGR
jgi:hypothetical protein